jgi:hypothetical protein
MKAVDPRSLIRITLKTRGFDILSAFSLHGILTGAEGKAETTWIANLGLLGKMTGAAAIVSSDLKLEENGKISIETSLKALGVLGKLKLTQFRPNPPFIQTTSGSKKCVIPTNPIQHSRSLCLHTSGPFFVFGHADYYTRRSYSRAHRFSFEN